MIVMLAFQNLFVVFFENVNDKFQMLLINCFLTTQMVLNVYAKDHFLYKKLLHTGGNLSKLI